MTCRWDPAVAHNLAARIGSPLEGHSSHAHKVVGAARFSLVRCIRGRPSSSTACSLGVPLLTRSSPG